MSKNFYRAGGTALAASLLITLLGTSGSSAAAENTAIPLTSEAGAAPAGKSLEAIFQALDQADGAIQPQPTFALPAPSEAAEQTPPPVAASSLEQLVAAQADTSEPTDELKCLAGAIYFEARSETLEGQLAVGRVVVARTRSGRFPASYCGVIHQPSQFPWARTAAMPHINVQSPAWQRALAMARIADAGSWQSTAEGALFFHTAHVTTSARVQRVTQIDHHIFYR